MVALDDSDLILARGQILDDELPSRVDLRHLHILPGLIDSTRNGNEPVSVRHRPADDPKFAANRERAVSQDDADAGYLLTRLDLNSYSPGANLSITNRPFPSALAPPPPESKAG